MTLMMMMVVMMSMRKRNAACDTDDGDDDAPQDLRGQSVGVPGELKGLWEVYNEWGR